MTVLPSYSSSTFLAGFAVGVFTLFVLGVVTERDIRHMGARIVDDAAISAAQNQIADDDDIGEIDGMAAVLAVSDQPAGQTASVERVEMSIAGWVVIHETEGGHVLNALGAARLDAGLHENVAVELLRGMEPGGSYAVILYTDNGNKEFEIRGDLPVIDTSGNPVMKLFRTWGGAASQ